MAERQDPATEQIRLAEYELAERLERRFASRLRWLILILVLALVSFGVLAHVATRNAVERRAVELARAEALRVLEGSKPDVPALRQELREDAQYLKDQLAASQVDFQLRLERLLERANKLEKAMAEFEEDSNMLAASRIQFTQHQRAIAREAERIEELRTRFDAELAAAQRENARLGQNASIMVKQELENLGARVERELDELRAIMADHQAGAPAMYSTWLDLEGRAGQIQGTNFGNEPGRVFVRVRAFTPGELELIGESDSLLVPLGDWTDSEIELKPNSSLIERLAEARTVATDKGQDRTDSVIRYGFMIQTAAGKLSHWSGKWADSVVPPERGTIATQ
jgi:hypothetical protein